jgi:4-amino-4-deoxy-L-arabinose transferase-like glycosyltransferase
MPLNKIKITSNFILFLIIITGFVLRILGVINIGLGGDFAIHWNIAQEIVKNHNFPLLGPQASMNDNFHLGPFYYYLLSIPYFLGGGNFKVAIIFFSILSSISVYLLYKTCLNWFSQNVSLKIAALYSLSSYMISVGNFPWNPNVLPLLTIIQLYLLTKVQKGKLIFIPLMFLIFGLSIQAHTTAVFLIPIFLMLLPLRKIKIYHYLAGIFLLLLSLSPWITSNLHCQFCEVEQAIQIFGSGKVEQCDFSAWIKNHGNGERCFNYIRNTLYAFRFMSVNLIGSQSIPAALVSIFLIIWFIFKVNSPRIDFIKLWLVLVMVFFLFYASNIYLHYFLILTPLPFLIVVLSLEKIKQISQVGKYIGEITFYLLILVNVFLAVYNLQFGRI